MISKRPKGRNVGVSHQRVERNEQFLGVLISDNKPKVDDSSNGSINFEVAVIAEALNFNVESIRSSKVANVMLS